MAAERPPVAATFGRFPGPARTCPPLAATNGHDAYVSTGQTEQWACPPASRAAAAPNRPEPQLLG
ncbi:hypothetical protein ABIB51_000652 [Arthrobacter sp. UYCu712]